MVTLSYLIKAPPRVTRPPCPCIGSGNHPLIKKVDGNHKQVWYADDAAAVGKIVDLRDWSDRLSITGPGFCYFPNASKTWLVTKKELHDAAISVFTNTGVNVTSDGRPYLGVAIGIQEYVTRYVESKVNEWIANLHCLATIAKTQLHTAFAILTHGLMSKWTYLSRTTPGTGSLLRPLYDTL